VKSNLNLSQLGTQGTYARIQIFRTELERRRKEKREKKKKKKKAMKVKLRMITEEVCNMEGAFGLGSG